MKRLISTMTLAGILVTAIGCSNIVGSWRTVAVMPEGMVFPISNVDFDKEGIYTATSKYNGESHTSTGTYKWNGRMLTVIPASGPQREYPGRIRVDGKLALTHDQDGEQVEAVLEKTDG
ncbi:MAG: hypothetical protein IID36_10590 [Planctomycetes bacterium]|nr:hypothetical protein [Planctomycetota bacterium]